MLLFSLFLCLGLYLQTYFRPIITFSFGSVILKIKSIIICTSTNPSVQSVEFLVHPDPPSHPFKVFIHLELIILSSFQTSLCSNRNRLEKRCCFSATSSVLVSISANVRYGHSVKSLLFHSTFTFHLFQVALSPCRLSFCGI